MKLTKTETVDMNSPGAKGRFSRKYRDRFSAHIGRCSSVSYKDSQEAALARSTLNSMKAEIEGMK